MGIWGKTVLLLVTLTFVKVLCGNASPASAATFAHKTCSDCHEADNKLKAADVNELCTSCHPANVTDHKIGVVPKTIPAGLPLDKDKKMTCITCHEPHGKGTANKLLRKKTDDICLSCHQK